MSGSSKITFSWQMAEQLAAEHMRGSGFFDARITPPGRDGGLDVVASNAVAQVKHQHSPVGSPDIQRLRGAAHRVEHALFYSSSGYSVSGIAAARDSGIALFTFDEKNHVWATNERALVLSIGQLKPMKRVSLIRRSTIEFLSVAGAFSDLVKSAIKNMEADTDASAWWAFAAETPALAIVQEMATVWKALNKSLKRVDVVSATKWAGRGLALSEDVTAMVSRQHVVVIDAFAAALPIRRKEQKRNFAR